MVEEGSSGEEDEDTEEEVTPRARGRPKAGSKPKAKGKRKAQRKTGGLNSDEIGDDCDRESDLMETDGSDNGEDLLDFIVSDNHPASSTREHRSLTATSPPASFSSTTAGVEDEAMKPFFVRTQFSGTQESEEIPDLDDIFKKNGKRSEPELSDDDVAVRRTARGRRAVVDDSESDV
jgi:ATP-dependent DNA helicase MPH1